jgi:cyclic beta-1,2-glucan synthetase
MPPVGHFLSNGAYTTLVTDDGTGFSSCGADRLNAWSGDWIEELGGFFIYIRDIDAGAMWSVGRRPVPGLPSGYAARSRPGAFEIEREDGQISTRTEICVSPDDDLELRRVILINQSGRSRSIEITSFVEVVLAPAASFAAHPAFSKLFVQTAFEARPGALLAMRRPRSKEESHPCMLHTLLEAKDLQIETDRARFLGRLRDPSAPRAMDSGSPLSGTTGTVLDPILSLRRNLTLGPGATIGTTFLLAAAAGRQEALSIAERNAEPGRADDTFSRARTRAADRLRELGMSAAEAESAEELAAAMMYAHPALRAAPEILCRARGPLADLRLYGLSPLRPYAVLHAESPAGARHLPQLLAAHRYWRSLGLPLDLFVLGGSWDPRESTKEGPIDPHILWRSSGDLAQPVIDRIDAAASLVVTHALPDLHAPGARTAS